MIIINKLKKNFGEKIAVDIKHYEIQSRRYARISGKQRCR